MKRFLQIGFFALVLGFLLYLIPQVRLVVNEAIKTQVAEMVQLEPCGCRADSPPDFCITEFVVAGTCNSGQQPVATAPEFNTGLSVRFGGELVQNQPSETTSNVTNPGITTPSTSSLGVTTPGITSPNLEPNFQSLPDAGAVKLDRSTPVLEFQGPTTTTATDAVVATPVETSSSSSDIQFLQGSSQNYDAFQYIQEKLADAYGVSISISDIFYPEQDILPIQGGYFHWANFYAYFQVFHPALDDPTELQKLIQEYFNQDGVTFEDVGGLVELLAESYGFGINNQGQLDSAATAVVFSVIYPGNALISVNGGYFEFDSFINRFEAQHPPVDQSELLALIDEAFATYGVSETITTFTPPEEEITSTPGGSPDSGIDGSVDQADTDLVCPIEDVLKDFDYGAAEGGNIPVNAEDAPHFVSHNEYYVVKLGPEVDAPEWKRDDKNDSPDQDGMNLSTSGQGKLDLDITHLVGNGLNYELEGTQHLGTIIVGRYNKVNDDVYDFSVIAAESVRKYNNELRGPDLRFPPGAVLPDNSPYTIGLLANAFQENTEGWLTVIYTAADTFNYSFSINELFSWDGFHQTLMQIFNIPATHPYDPTIPPGEIEDYRFCYRDLNGDGTPDFRYYKPDDPAYKIHCPDPVQQETEVLVEPGIDDTINITFICQQTQSQVCNIPSNTGGGAGNFGGGTTTTPTVGSNQPLADYVVALLTAYKQNPSANTAQVRLELMYQYLISVLPAVGNNP